MTKAYVPHLSSNTLSQYLRAKTQGSVQRDCIIATNDLSLSHSDNRVSRTRVIMCMTSYTESVTKPKMRRLLGFLTEGIVSRLVSKVLKPSDRRIRVMYVVGGD